MIVGLAGGPRRARGSAAPADGIIHMRFDFDFDPRHFVRAERDAFWEFTLGLEAIDLAPTQKDAFGAQFYKS